MKTKGLIILCAMTLLLSGCSYSNLGVEGLLYAPKLSEEQTVIHQTLIDSVGTNIQLKYPKTGDNRSAILFANLDDEPTQEALVFYQKTNSSGTDNTIRINVLDNLNGKWQSVYDLGGMSTDVDKIVISKLGSSNSVNIIVGFNTVNKAEKVLKIYNYENKQLKEIYSDNYSVMETMDMDQDNQNELITVTNSTGNTNGQAKMFKSVDGQIKCVSTVDMEKDTVEYKNIVKGKIDDNSPSIYVDALKTNGALKTEVLNFKYNMLNNPLFLNSNATNLNTTRPIGYSSIDIDNDGIVEIPLVKPFLGYQQMPLDQQINQTTWYSVLDYFNLKAKYTSYFNINDGYVFIIPDKWKSVVTLKTDTKTDEVIFFKYDGQLSDNMTELLRIRVCVRKNTQELEYEGYDKIKSKGQIDYLVRLKNGDPLSLSLLEFVNNFYVL